jgi:hypothetical protein
MDQVHIMQVIHTHFIHMGTMLITSIMVLTIQPHLTCQMPTTQMLLEPMPLLISFPFGRELFTGTTVVIENINLMSMRRHLLTLSTLTTQQNIVLEVPQELQVQTAQQELLEQMVLEDLPPHHQVQEVLAKEAEQVVEAV